MQVISNIFILRGYFQINAKLGGTQTLWLFLMNAMIQG